MIKHKFISFHNVTLHDWLKNSRHFFIQSEVRVKSIMIRSHTFSSASRQLQYFEFWLVYWVVFVFVIGRSLTFGFIFTKFNKNRSNMSQIELEVVYINRDGKSMHETSDSRSVTMLRLNKILIGNEKLLTVLIYYIAYYLCICHQWNTDLDHIHTCTSHECWRTRGTRLYSCKSLRRGIRWYLINVKTKYNNPNADYVILVCIIVLPCFMELNFPRRNICDLSLTSSKTAP